ncbi:E3 ubiquitin-protein ligase TRIM47-like [Cheilinus undulatus]|uniref:E3 ubiquitin-protein ligase TRIM47-like n=1 Tax=Cheilinus undulatus TaxID=241271 RepID=UPI001BD4B20F|nr:E3 ubiquitin-protein ligase TRIM47-like [Cheilinus undulatus]
MSAVSSLLCEDQFLCAICLDVFTDPVSTPCGHNFCKTCITSHWGSDVQVRCPLCKKTFPTKPELQINTLISEMAAHVKGTAAHKATSSSSEQQVAKPGEILCDICTGTKLKALKSCLVCLVSYCEIHLEPHLRAAGLKSHQLIDPVENLEDRMCQTHNKPLELFCKTDQKCICMLCSILDHKTHEVVPLKEEYEKKKTELGETEAKLQQMIQEREVKIQEFKESVKVSRENTDKKIASGVQILTELKEAVERNQAMMVEKMEQEHRVTEKKAEGYIKEIEQEISDLRKRSAEVKQLSYSEDHLHFLQNFPPLKAPPIIKSWKLVKVHLPTYAGIMRTVGKELVKILKKEAEMKKAVI